MHRRREERVLRERGTPNVERADGARGRRTEERERNAGVRRPARPEEERHARESDDQADHGGHREPPAERQAVEQGDVQWDHRDDQGRKPGVEPGLGPGDAGVADREQEAAGDRGGTPFAPARPESPRREGVEDRPGEEESRGGHQQRRHRPVGDAHREIGRAPDEVDGREGDCYRRRRPACEGGCHCRYRVESTPYKTASGPTTRMKTRAIISIAPSLSAWRPIRTNPATIWFDYGT